MQEEQRPILKYVFRFLRFICPDHLYEEIEGDLIQRFSKDAHRYGQRRAHRKLLWNALRFLRPGIVLRNKLSIQISPVAMWYHYSKIMMRNVLRHKFHSAINVLGLTLGMTFALLVGVFIRQELRVNTTLKDVDQLYLLENRYTGAADNNVWFSPAPLARQAAEQYPALVENYYRFWDRQVTVSKGDKHFRIQSMIGDTTFLDVFGFQVLAGDGHSALMGPGSLVITEKVARQFFDKTDVVGETLSISSEREGIKEFMIKAVIADPEDKNSVSDFMNMDAQVYMTLHDRAAFTLVDDLDLWATDVITYIKLARTADAGQAQEALNVLMKANLPKDVGARRSIAINPLADYYVVSNQGAVKKLILALTLIVLFILMLAIANFVNITLASSFSRLREVGVRKVIGGVRHQVMLQFLGESVLLAAFSGSLALIFYEALRGYSGAILGSALPAVIRFDRSLWILVSAGIVLTGVLAGAYPALYLSTTHTIQSLKGKFKSVTGTLRFSRVLIGVQFLVVVFVLVAALILSRQMSYFLEKDRGYDAGAVLNVTSVPRLWSAEGFGIMETAKREFLASPKVKAVSLSWGAPNRSMSQGEFKAHTPGRPLEDAVPVTVAAVDEDFLEVYDMKLISGKFFFEAPGQRPPFTLVINESAQRALHVQPGDRIRIQPWTPEFTIAGVVGDFHFDTFHVPIAPMVLMHARDYGTYRAFSFRLEPGDLAGGVEAVEHMWKNVFPNDPFVYSFHDERLQELYKTERQLQQAAAVATVLMIVIVLTGVVGLVSLTVHRRSKEIGIRKVLGSSVSGILMLISREYVVIMLASFALGLMAAYSVMSWWLNAFQYRIGLAWWMFLVPPVLVFVVTLLLVSLQSLKTAMADPVKAIKSGE